MRIEDENLIIDDGVWKCKAKKNKLHIEKIIRIICINYNSTLL